MLFNSVGFLVFFALFFAIWGSLSSGWRRLWLLGGSWLFYASWEPVFLTLLLFSTVLDHQVGVRLDRTIAPLQRKALLALSLLGNLGLLALFKYGDFILETLGLLSAPARPQGFHTAGSIPPGISFYTFQTLSYTIDVYRGKSRACRSFVDFAIYVAFFPQLVAGPILRIHQFLPQLRALVPATRAQIIQGAELFAVGMFKKVVIADNIGVLIDPVYANVGACSGPTLLLAANLFAAQVYCDFSGYSTMARGLAKMLGFQLPKNFSYPWLATSPLGFRRGWHITMSEWFRDYVFHPLGGTRRGKVRTSINILVVWALFGLWHGASWSFVLWGLYNGVVQVLYRLFFAGRHSEESPPRQLLGWTVTVSLLVPSSLFFRSPSGTDGLAAVQHLLAFQRHGEAGLEGYWWVPVGLLAVHMACKLLYTEDVISRLSGPVRLGLLTAAALLIFVAAPEQRPFIYFQF